MHRHGVTQKRRGAQNALRHVWGQRSEIRWQFR